MLSYRHRHTCTCIWGQRSALGDGSQVLSISVFEVWSLTNLGPSRLDVIEPQDSPASIALALGFTRAQHHV